ncbi:MAG: hypothetical protein HYZ11_12595 [Candidatus Tectomicrobia bacterium]|uniref:Uncharacterized protein n=1 Tax=Tectimicrobiota bacterium TaxID=2528274 RepID=A0A932I006_UNCTE|nr:hypothetical protein [Candidatus Tectomicrobia bacterium]
MSPPAPRSALAAWWDNRSGAYLRENLGPVESEVRAQLAPLLFPPAAEPTLPEVCLPLAFAHLRLLAGEELNVVLRRLEGLARLFGAPGARVPVGAVYLLLTALTSTPGRLSSLARAQTAFFSLLLRRLAGLLDQGAGEDAIRRELTEAWGIQADQAAGLALNGARALWRRLQDPGLGLRPLSFDLNEWLAARDLAGAAAGARRLFPGAGEHPHLAPLVERLAAAEAIRGALERGGEPARIAEWAGTHALLLDSLRGAAENLVPWEAEGLRPAVPLLSALLGWSRRLGLLDQGEAPTAQPGRERLPDWLREFLASGAPPAAIPSGPPLGESGRGGVLAAGRFLVGSGTYLAAGVDAKAPSGAASASLSLEPPAAGGEEAAIALRFGTGEARRFPFRLSDGKDLLAALHLGDQPDVRFDLIVRGEDGLWRFGASFYLAPPPAEREAWTRGLLEYLHLRHGGEEDRIKVAILRGMPGGREGGDVPSAGGSGGPVSP